jgi:hypothetical protein
MFNKTIIINVYTFTVPYMPTLERLKAVRMGGGVQNFFSEGHKMVHSSAFLIYNLCSQNFKYSMIKP